MANKTFKIMDSAGLHARPATVLVNTASKFSSDIELEYNGQKVNLKSLMGVLSLGVKSEEEITIHTNGDDADDAIAELEKSLQDNNLL